MAHFFGRNKTYEMKYTKNSLFKHYLKGLISILIIPFIIFYLILFWFNLRSTEDAFRYTSTEILARSVTTMDNLFEVVYKNYESVASTPVVQTFLLKDFFTYNTGHQTYLSNLEISEQLQSICTSLNYLNSIHIYSKANSYYLSSSNSGYADKFYDRDCTVIYNNCNSSIAMVPRTLHDERILTLCYIMNKNEDNEGAVFFNIDIKKLLPTLIDTENAGTLLLCDKKGKTLISSDGDYSGILTENPDSPYREYKISKNNNNVSMSTRLNYENLTLNYLVTRKTYFKAFYPFTANTIIFFIFTFSALVLLSVVGTLKLYNSISKAFAYLENPSSDKNTFGEFQFLTENMMSQVDGTENAETTLADKIEKLKKYQALALQTQINPHFLFNSLNLISSYALESSNEDSPLVTIVDKLSDILRFCLNTKNYIIKTEEEINATKKYIEIENIKHDYQIDFIFDIEDKIYSFYTLKMILQPIIENSIIHGVNLLRKEQGFVKISGKVCGKNIVFTVLNNGPSINPEHLKNLQESLFSVEDIPENNHIGLRNVNQRIKLLFGNEYGCTIDSADNLTTVTITLPTIEKKGI